MAKAPEWGMYGKEPACEHLLALRAYLEDQDIQIWGEKTESPTGWVGVYCHRCKRVYEVTLREPFEVWN